MTAVSRERDVPGVGLGASRSPDTEFAAPPSVSQDCHAILDGKIRCELADHDGHKHRNGPLVWHEPPLILVDGLEPDLTVESERWQNGRVLLFDDVEPDLGA